MKMRSFVAITKLGVFGMNEGILTQFDLHNFDHGSTQRGEFTQSS